MGDINFDYFFYKDLKLLVDLIGILFYQIVYSCIIDYGSCLDYIYINRLVMNYFQGILFVILELFYFDYKFIVAYILV